MLEEGDRAWSAWVERLAGSGKREVGGTASSGRMRWVGKGGCEQVIEEK